MVVLGLALCYLLGFAVLLSISRKYSLAEIIGYSFLLGIGIETIFLFLLDVANIRYSPTVLIGLNLLCIGILLGINFRKLKDFEISPSPNSFLQLRNLNLPAIFLGCIIAFLFYSVTVKCLFWPPLERDSFGSFDKLARVMAVEGKLKISLFEYKLEGAGGIYPPLYHASMAYVYLFGAELPKIITTLFFLSTLLVFFDVTRKYIGATGAAFFTLVMMLTPEYFAHAALALGNLPTTAYVCAAALCTFAWLDKREEKFFWLGAIMMGFVVWIRSDTIVFTAAALGIMGIDFLRKRNWKRFLAYSTISVVPFVIWALYLKFKIQNVPSGKFDFGIGFNQERWDLVTGYTKAYLFGGSYSFNGIGGIDGGQLFGVSFVLFFLLLVVNIAAVVILFYKKADWKNALGTGANVLLFFLLSFTAFFLLFYFIDVEVQASPLWSLMYSSFKRGMFYFLPIVFFYIATSYASTQLFERLEKFRTAKT